MSVTPHYNTFPPDYVRVFERNCPGVRLNKDERAELERLFTLMRDVMKKKVHAA